MKETGLLIILIILAGLILCALIRAVKGPKFTDRIIAVNCINTMVIVLIALLSVYLQLDYLSDVALIYALIGFTANVVLTRLLLNRHNQKEIQQPSYEERQKEEEE